MVSGGKARSRCVLQTVLGIGSGISIIMEIGLRELQHNFPGLPTVYPYEGGTLGTVTDDQRQKIPQQTGLLAAYVMTPWARM